MDFVFFEVLRNRSNYLTPTIPNPIDQRGSIDIYSRSPQQFSGHLQDKMEFTSMILNAGLRLDYFKANAVYAPGPFAPSQNIVDAEGKFTISPRLGISFPITR